MVAVVEKVVPVTEEGTTATTCPSSETEVTRTATFDSKKFHSSYH